MPSNKNNSSDNNKSKPEKRGSEQMTGKVARITSAKRGKRAENAKHKELAAFERRWTGSLEDKESGLCTPATFEHVKSQIDDYILHQLLADFFVVRDDEEICVGRFEVDFDRPKVQDMEGWNNLPEEAKKKLLARPMPRKLTKIKNINSLNLLYENRLVWYPRIKHRAGSEGGPYVHWDEANPVKIWRRHPGRPTFHGVVFQPGAWGEEGFGRSISEKMENGETVQNLNLWTGWAIEPAFKKDPHKLKDGSMSRPLPDLDACKRIRGHVLDVLCAGDVGAYRWMTYWLAHLVQNPRQKLPTTVAITGPQGVGKGSFFTGIIAAFFMPAHTWAFNDVQQVTGKFYDSRTALWTILDEAIWSGDVRAANKMKAMISEVMTSQEEKGRQQRQVKTLGRYGIITNERGAAHLDHDDRRYFITQARNPFGNDKRQLKEYMRAFWHEVNNGGLEAYFGYLLSLDIEGSGLDLTTAYETAEKGTQKQLSMRPHEQWLFECLDNGSWGERLGPRGDISMKWEDFGVGSDRDPLAPKTAIKDSWAAWLKTSHNKAFKISDAELFRFLAEKLGMVSVTERPTITNDDPVHIMVQGRARYIVLPSLEEARTNWQQNMFRVAEWNPAEAPPLTDEDNELLAMVADLKEATWANDNPKPDRSKELDDAPF